MDDFFLAEDKMGMSLTCSSVSLKKNESNLIGISIGGGSPHCPCLYVVQIFDNTSASEDGSLSAGDEIIGVNSTNVKGKNKAEVARLIQSLKNEVCITYNKLHADVKQGKTLDIVLKKFKHRLVEKMSSNTADALGLSRAILCNDCMVKKLRALESTERMYIGLVDRLRRVMRAVFDLSCIIKAFGDTFAVIGAREQQANASHVFTDFGNVHRTMEKYALTMLKQISPILNDLGTYIHKAIPDTKQTIGKYLDAKFEYLSYCLKVKELDDEECNFSAIHEPLYRVETGNYEYRLLLLCRQQARKRFGQLRSDVLEKLELLDQKHVQDIVTQLQRYLAGLAEYYARSFRLMDGQSYFPIEVNLDSTLGHAIDEETASFQNDGLDGADEDAALLDMGTQEMQSLLLDEEQILSQRCDGNTASLLDPNWLE